MEGRATHWDILAFLPFIGWFNVNYKVTSKGLGANGGNIKIAPRNPKISIYRGTDLGIEMRVYQETGYIMSDAARDAYLVARLSENKSIKHSIETARKASKRAHKTQIKFWGSLDEYVRAHGDAPDLVKEVGPRSMISFTTDPNVLDRFYTQGRGNIFSREVPSDLIIPQTLETSTESEVLILHMIKNTRIIN